MNTPRTTLLVFLIIQCLFLTAQNQLPKTSGRSSAMAGIQSPLADVWSVVGNPAAMAVLQKTELGFYFENRFGQKELSGQNLALAVPTKLGVVGVHLSHFGYSLYSEGLVGVGFGRELIPEYLSMGMKCNFFQLNLGSELGQRHLFLFEFGVYCKPTKRLGLGLHFYNPFPQPVNNDNLSETASAINFGGTYTFEQNVVLALEASKDFSLPKADFKLGLEFSLLKQFAMRFGAGSYPVRQTFGVGFRRKLFSVDFSFSRHVVLGYSPACSVQYSF